MEFSEVPRPGSVAAKKSGCLCPIENNNKGKGNVMRISRRELGISEDSSTERVKAFIIIEGCPLHWPNNDQPVPSNIDPDKYYTAQEAAEILSCSNSQVWKMMDRGQLQSIKLGGVRARRILGITIIEMIKKGGVD